jgi:hypothetical protein
MVQVIATVVKLGGWNERTMSDGELVGFIKFPIPPRGLIEAQSFICAVDKYGEFWG